MIRKHSGLRRAFGAVLVMLMLGGCATGAPSPTADPTAKQKTDTEKEKELSQMEQAGKRD